MVVSREGLQGGEWNDHPGWKETNKRKALLRPAWTSEVWLNQPLQPQDKNKGWRKAVWCLWQLAVKPPVNQPPPTDVGGQNKVICKVSKNLPFPRKLLEDILTPNEGRKPAVQEGESSKGDTCVLHRTFTFPLHPFVVVVVVKYLSVSWLSSFTLWNLPKGMKSDKCPNAAKIHCSF